MRHLGFITVGKILEELRKETEYRITRATFYNLDSRLCFPIPKRTTGKVRWRIYTRKEAELIKNLIKAEYAFEGDIFDIGDPLY